MSNIKSAPDSSSGGENRLRRKMDKKSKYWRVYALSNNTKHGDDYYSVYVGDRSEVLIASVADGVSSSSLGIVAAYIISNIFINCSLTEIRDKVYSKDLLSANKSIVKCISESINNIDDTIIKQLLDRYQECLNMNNYIKMINEHECSNHLISMNITKYKQCIIEKIVKYITNAMIDSNKYISKDDSEYISNIMYMKCTRQKVRVSEQNFNPTTTFIGVIMDKNNINIFKAGDSNYAIVYRSGEIVTQSEPVNDSITGYYSIKDGFKNLHIQTFPADDVLELYLYTDGAMPHYSEPGGRNWILFTKKRNRTSIDKLPEEWLNTLVGYNALNDDYTMVVIQRVIDDEVNSE